MRLENNVKQLQVALEDTSIEEVSEIIEKMTSLKNNLLKLNKKKFDNKSSIKSAVRALGDDNLIITFKDKPHSKFTRPPKYQYIDENGIKKTWWGGGKMPNALKMAITNSDGVEDKSLLENYLIPSAEGKYQYKDMEGNICFWDGQGETPKDLQVLLNNGFSIEDFAIDAKVKSKPRPLMIHPKGSVYRFEDTKGAVVIWDPEQCEMPLELLKKITVLGQPRPELLKKYLVINN